VPSPSSARPPAGRRLAAAAAALLLLLPLAQAALGAVAQAATETREDWYRVEIAGAPAGWVLTRERTAGGEITTETEMELRLKRGGTEMSMALGTRFVETAGGEPLSMWVSQNMGQVPVETTYRFGPDRLEMRSVQGDSVSEKTLPRPPGSWLPPAATQRLVARQVAAGAAAYTYRTVDPSEGPVPVEVIGQRMETGVEVPLPDGRKVATSRWEQTQQPGPGVSTTVYLDGDGRLVKSVTPMMGFEMVMILTDQATAQRPGGAPELLVGTFVRPDRPIAEPRRTRRAVYELRAPGGGPDALPSAGAQKVELRDGVPRVTVERGATSPAGGEDPTPYLEASAFLNYRDPAVAALARRALAGAPEAPAARAEALRAFVHRYLEQKDLGTGFATASEVVATRSGDCTEHSVLLAALLRAAGIPARVVAGLLYVERFAGQRDLFGYHMWTQALVGGRWLDLDALTPDPFDATHVALTTSALSDGEGFLTAASTLATLVGGLEIRVVDVER
jgi:Transglutaminase-like superfamily